MNGEFTHRAYFAFFQVARVLISRCPESRVLITGCPAPGALNTGCPESGALITGCPKSGVLNHYALSGGNILRMMPGRSSGDFAMQAADANSSGDAA